MGLEELDLTKPGKIWAMPEYESTTTFHMVVPKDNYTKANIVANPQLIAAGDELMTPFPVPHAQLDKDGRAVLDFQKSGKAKELMDNLEAMVNKNSPVHQIRAVILADWAPGNHNPDKVAVEILDFAVAAFPIITLLGKQTKAAAAEVKAGTVKALSAEFRATLPMKEVKITIEPTIEFEVNGQKAKGSMVVQVKEGQAYPINIPITIAKGAINKLTPAQVNDFNTFLYSHPHGLGNRASDAGAHIIDPTANIPANLIVDGGLFPLTVTQRLTARRPAYNSYHPSSNWRQIAPYAPWGWNGQSGGYNIYDYDGYLDIETDENWGSKDFMITVEGTGAYSSTVKKLPLRLEGWAPGFVFGNMPRTFNHNAC